MFNMYNYAFRKLWNSFFADLPPCCQAYVEATTNLWKVLSGKSFRNYLIEYAPNFFLISNVYPLFANPFPIKKFPSGFWWLLLHCLLWLSCPRSTFYVQPHWFFSSSWLWASCLRDFTLSVLSSWGHSFPWSLSASSQPKGQLCRYPQPL